MDKMQRSSKNDPQLKPRAHVFLALMRAFAERGDVDLVGSLRERMVPEAAGQVWAEDRAEADELYIEAAVLAGQVTMEMKIILFFHLIPVGHIFCVNNCSNSNGWAKSRPFLGLGNTDESS